MAHLLFDAAQMTSQGDDIFRNKGSKLGERQKLDTSDSFRDASFLPSFMRISACAHTHAQKENKNKYKCIAYPAVPNCQLQHRTRERLNTAVEKKKRTIKTERRKGSQRKVYAQPRPA